MATLTRGLVSLWSQLGPRFLPFADAATPDLPLPRLLRLSLFQVSVGMALGLLVGTLNRVMIAELHVPASLVAIMVALPVLYAPFRALVGFRSDNHRSALGWRRVPYIWMGTLLQFGGFAIMPFALLVLSGGGNASAWPAWIGQLGAGLAFLLVGAGLHTTQTAGLALATDLAPVESHPRVVGLMYVMLLLGTLVSSLIFGAFLREFTPGRLVQVIQAAAVTTLILNTLAMWKQESRNPERRPRSDCREPNFAEAWATFSAQPGVTLRLTAIALGCMAFGMQDVLLEPYGAQVLGLSVGSTTLLTALVAAGGLLGFSLASKVLAKGFDPAKMATLGAAVGLPAFGCVLIATSTLSVGIFATGALLIGFGAGLFSHGTLTVTMNEAPAEQAGLALGAWGAVSATASGVALAAGGILRDAAQLWWGADGTGAVGSAVGSGAHSAAHLANEPAIAAAAQGNPSVGYSVVYGTEIVLLVLTILVLRKLLRQRSPTGRSSAAADGRVTQ